MSDLKNMFSAEFTEANQTHLLSVLDAGLKCLETRHPTNYSLHGLAADDLGMEYMRLKTAEFPWLSDVSPEFAKFYREWVTANRKRIDTVLSRS